MESQLSSDQLSQLAPLLGSLARLIASHGAVTEDQIHVLLDATNLDAHPAALAELKRWARLLARVHESPSPVLRQTVVESLQLRGLPEATVLLAVATVAGSGTPPTPPPAVGTTVAPQPPSVPTRLHASVTNLDFGSLQPGQTTTLEFDVQGGPGHVVIENDHVQVAPMQFGVGTTHLRVGIKPLASGLLFTNLKLVTAGETLEVPIMAQWQDGGAVPAKLVLDSLVVPPPVAAARQPQPIKPPPAPPVVVSPPPASGQEIGVQPVIRPLVQPMRVQPPPATPKPPPKKPNPPSAWKRIADIGLGLWLVIVVVGIFYTGAIGIGSVLLGLWLVLVVVSIFVKVVFK